MYWRSKSEICLKKVFLMNISWVFIFPFFYLLLYNSYWILIIIIENILLSSIQFILVFHHFILLNTWIPIEYDDLNSFIEETQFFSFFTFSLRFRKMSIENGWFYETEAMWDGMSVHHLFIRSTLWIKSKRSIISWKIRISSIPYWLTVFHRIS